jgi:gluconolactonase
VSAVAPDLVPRSAELRRLATGFRFTEGPVWHGDGFLLFSDIQGDAIHRWDGSGVSVFRSPSSWANGLAYDREGRLLTCEHTTSRLTRTEHDGSITVIASHYDGKELNSPNDVVCKSDGAIYFTDPMSGRTARMGAGVERAPELPFLGVYRVVPGGEPALLASDFAFPNGLCFSPDETLLYVNDTARFHVRVFDVVPDGTIENGRVFLGQPLSERYSTGKPDGMKVDEHGNVWATGPGGVWVARPDGELLGVVETPEVAQNLAFGGPDGRTLFVTAGGSLYAIETSVRGGR